MTEKQVLLVKHSWSYVAGQADEVTAILIKKLILLAPDLKPLILKLDSENKLKDTVMTVNDFVASLPDLKKAEKKVLYLIADYSDKQITKKNYEIALNAFLQSLEKQLGEIWNQEIYEAWIVAFTAMHKHLLNQLEIPSALLQKHI